MLKLIGQTRGHDLGEIAIQKLNITMKSKMKAIVDCFHNLFNKKTLKRIGLDIIKLNLLFVSKMLLNIGFCLSNNLILKSI